jgi:hypothetical protein
MGLVHGSLVPLARGFLWWDNMVIFFYENNMVIGVFSEPIFWLLIAYIIQ